jgi:hypothetical protein
MLAIIHVLAPLPAEVPVVTVERRGLVIKLCSDKIFTFEGVAALNAADKTFLAGGQWFQLWRGEIISINSPEPETGSITHAGVHRGPLVDKAAGPRNR